MTIGLSSISLISVLHFEKQQKNGSVTLHLSQHKNLDHYGPHIAAKPRQLQLNSGKKSSSGIMLSASESSFACLMMCMTGFQLHNF